MGLPDFAEGFHALFTRLRFVVVFVSLTVVSSASHVVAQPAARDDDHHATSTQAPTVCRTQAIPEAAWRQAKLHAGLATRNR